MAATIDATVGGANANCYVESVAVAQDYYDERLNVSAWTNATEDEKTRALISATRWLDTVPFTGVKVSQSQALQWPRYGATDHDGYEFDTASIPLLIQHATMELALVLLRDADGGTDTLAATGMEGFDSVRVGPIAVDLRGGKRAADMPDNVKAMLRPVAVYADGVGRTELA